MQSHRLVRTLHRAVAALTFAVVFVLVVSAAARAADEPTLEEMLEAPAGFTQSHLGTRAVPLEKWYPLVGVPSTAFVAARVTVWRPSGSGRAMQVQAVRLVDAGAAFAAEIAYSKPEDGWESFEGPAASGVRWSRKAMTDALGEQFWAVEATRVVGRDLLTYMRPSDDDVPRPEQVSAVSLHSALWPSTPAGGGSPLLLVTGIGVVLVAGAVVATRLGRRPSPRQASPPALAPVPASQPARLANDLGSYFGGSPSA